MSVIDPFLDANPSLPAAPRIEGRELVMLRHDIRAALQGVIGSVERLDTAELTGATRVQFERIASAGRTLAALVGALLGDAPGAGTAPPIVELDRFLRQVRSRHLADAQARGLSLAVAAETGAPGALRLDHTALERIVDNLVSNAVKFGDTGTVRLGVARDPDGSVVFRVTDDGPGHAPEAARQLFRFGYRQPDSDKAGEGVGLHIVKHLTDRLGGEVSLGNRPSGGVEAVVRLPADVAAAAPAADEPPLADFTGLRILLAEDNLTNQMVAVQMLRALKAEVVVCSDGVEALEHFEAEHVDLVVVDIEMPRLSGLDVIRAIRARHDSRAQVPIVALTAYAMREHRDRIAAAGANGLISKPITSVEALGRGLAVYIAPLLRGAAAEAADPEAGESGPVIDAAVFQALCDAIGPEVMSELLDKVVADLLGAQRELDGALTTVARDPIRSASHILISVAGALGAMRLQNCARTLNAIAHSEDRDRIAATVRRCIDEIDAAVAFARARRAAE